MGSEQHHPVLELFVNGEEIDGALVREIQVKDNLSIPDAAVVKLVQPSVSHTTGTAPVDVVDDTRFDLGKDLEVKTGGIGDRVAQTVFKGTIVALEPEFTAAKKTLVVRAYDKTFFMNQEPKSRTFQNVKMSDVANRLLQDHGLVPEVDSTSGTFDFLYQANESDWAFLQRLARANDFELLVADGRARLRRMDRNRGAAVTLAYADDEAPAPGKVTLLEFAPRVTLAQQPSAVEVRYWDAKTASHKVAKESLAAVSPLAKVGGFTQSKIAGEARAGTARVSGRVANHDDASARAKALASRLAAASIQATGTAMGDPRLTAGTQVRIEGVGSRFTGDYVLSSTTHVYRQGAAYRTKFSISGRNANNLVELLGGGAAANGNGGRSWAQGLVVGVVTNTADPDELGRVRVKFPTLTDEHEGWWARIATPHAGRDRGIYFMPEVGDEVVVGFEQADITRPYVLGSLFNGKDKPPEGVYQKSGGPEADKVNGSLLVRTPKRFAVDAKDKVTMKTGDDFEIDAKGASIYKSGKTITIETSAMQNIVVKAGGDLQLQSTSPAGKVSISAGTVEITGKMAVNLKAPSLNLG